MTRTLLIVAALLLSNLVGIAAAAENNIEHKSKNARKLIATLDSVGINSPEVKNFIAEADAHVDNQYFYFTEQPAINGRVSLRYRFNSPDNAPIVANTANMPIKNRKMELHYTPENSRFEIVARTNGVMCNYHIELK